MAHKARPGATAGVLALLCGAGFMVHAQDIPPAGMTATLDVTQRLEYSDNPDIDVDGSSDFFGRTILNFGLISETSLENFRLDLGTDIEEGSNDKSSVDFTNSFLQLGYDRATRNASLGLSLRYRESDTSSSFFDDDFGQDGDVITQNSGTRQSYGFGLEGAFGIEAPIGTEFSLDYSEITYRDTTDPDLTDNSTFAGSGQVNFRIDPRITARLTAKYTDFDAQGDGVSRETTGIGAGVLLDITKTLQGDFAISYDSVERSGDQTGTNEGVTFTGSLTQDVRNGTWAVVVNSDVTSNNEGRRSFVRVQRSMELPRAQLDYSLGGTLSEDNDFDPLLDITYLHQMPTAELRFSMSQVFNTNNDNQEQINTTLRTDYSRQINSLSSVGADISFFSRNDLSATDNDGERLEVGLSYEYALTRDWGLVGGVRHVLVTSDSQEDRSSNTIFVGLQRNFVWNP